jgi:hypothetical protein
LPYGSAPPAAQYAVPYYGSVLTRDQELEMLKSQAEGFQQTLGDIQQRISEVEARKE